MENEINSESKKASSSSPTALLKRSTYEHLNKRVHLELHPINCFVKATD